jgi:hypothetical protein
MYNVVITFNIYLKSHMIFAIKHYDNKFIIEIKEYNLKFQIISRNK